MVCWDEVQRRAGAQREAVEALLHRRDLPPRVRERAEMVKAVALGYSQPGSPPGRDAGSGRSATGSGSLRGAGWRH